MRDAGPAPGRRCGARGGGAHAAPRPRLVADRGWSRVAPGPSRSSPHAGRVAGHRSRHAAASPRTRRRPHSGGHLRVQPIHASISPRGLTHVPLLAPAVRRLVCRLWLCLACNGAGQRSARYPRCEATQPPHRNQDIAVLGHPIPREAEIPVRLLREGEVVRGQDTERGASAGRRALAQGIAGCGDLPHDVAMSPPRPPITANMRRSHCLRPGNSNQRATKCKARSAGVARRYTAQFGASPPRRGGLGQLATAPAAVRVAPARHATGDAQGSWARQTLR